MEEVPADPQVTFPIDAEPMKGVMEDDTLMATPTAMETDPLHLAHQRDEESLAVTSTRAAYGPFDIEYMEFFNAVFNGELPNGYNAFDFCFFMHIVPPVIAGDLPWQSVASAGMSGIWLSTIPSIWRSWLLSRTRTSS